MTGWTRAIGFYGSGFLTLLLLHLIRIRLRKYHPDVFCRLGSPLFQDSNLGKTYWAFQRFVWWGHRSEVDDTVMRGLCVLASLSGLSVIIFFILLT
jgi:hypothetical protein